MLKNVQSYLGLYTFIYMYMHFLLIVWCFNYYYFRWGLWTILSILVLWNFHMVWLTVYLVSNLSSSCPLWIAYIVCLYPLKSKINIAWIVSVTTLRWVSGSFNNTWNTILFSFSGRRKRGADLLSKAFSNRRNLAETETSHWRVVIFWVG